MRQWGFGPAGTESDHRLQRLRNVEQWSINEGRIRFPSTVTPRTMAKGIRLAPISSPLSFKQQFPRYLFIISPNVDCMCHNCETMPNRGSRPKQTFVTLSHERRGTLSLDWTVFQRSPAKLALLTPEFPQFPVTDTMWKSYLVTGQKRLMGHLSGQARTESVWRVHEGEQLHPVIKAER